MLIFFYNFLFCSTKIYQMGKPYRLLPTSKFGDIDKFISYGICSCSWALNDDFHETKKMRTKNMEILILEMLAKFVEMTMNSD